MRRRLPYQRRCWNSSAVSHHLWLPFSSCGKCLHMLSLKWSIAFSLICPFRLAMSWLRRPNVWPCHVSLTVSRGTIQTSSFTRLHCAERDPPLDFYEVLHGGAWGYVHCPFGLFAAFRNGCWYFCHPPGTSCSRYRAASAFDHCVFWEVYSLRVLDLGFGFVKFPCSSPIGVRGVFGASLLTFSFAPVRGTDTPHFTLHTPHFAFNILPYTFYNLHITFHILTPRSTLYTPHFKIYTPHFTFHTSHSTLYNSHFTLHSTLYTPHSTLYTWDSTLYTLHLSPYTPHLKLYTLHSTVYTVHSTLHTPHFTLNTLHFTL